MYETYCRTYQRTLKIASHLLKWRQPVLLEGENSLLRLPDLIQSKGLKRVLIVTDAGIITLGLMDPFLEKLDEVGVSYTIFDKTVPNPTITNIEEAYLKYRAKRCEGIVAFGGGSPMDCAKGVAARVANPHRQIEQMKGFLKVRKAMPPFFAVPTTAGTGSETTVAAVVSNSYTHEKYALNDTSLIPHYAVLDPLLTLKLPPHITSTTGIDALTHAVEAYIGRSNTKETIEYSQQAVKIIFNYLYEAYENGDNIEARTQMQKASFLAGAAFTRAYVGNVHAIAHTLGGFYSVPHGLANAVILPYILDYYGEAVHKQLAELADIAGVGAHADTDAVKAEKFIEAIRELNASMNIPTTIEGIKDRDIPLMVERALAEANPFYPVPKIMNRVDMTGIYQAIKV